MRQLLSLIALSCVELNFKDHGVRCGPPRVNALVLRVVPTVPAQYKLVSFIFELLSHLLLALTVFIFWEEVCISYDVVHFGGDFADVLGRWIKSLLEIVSNLFLVAILALEPVFQSR